MTLREQIEELRRLDAARTPGEWKTTKKLSYLFVENYFKHVKKRDACVLAPDQAVLGASTDGFDGYVNLRQRDAEYICATTRTIPELLKAVDEMAEALRYIADENSIVKAHSGSARHCLERLGL